MLRHRTGALTTLGLLLWGASACDPKQLETPKVIAETDGIIRDIALDSTHVYWTNAGSDDVVLRVPRRDGATVEPLAQGDGSPFAIALGGTSVFYATSGGVEGDVLWEVSQSGGSPSSAASVDDSISHLVIDGDTLFYSTTAGTIYRTQAGQTPTAIATDQGDIGGLGYDDLRLYWVDTDAGALMRVDRGGGKSVSLAEGMSRPRGLAVEGGSAFVTAGVADRGIGGEVLRISLSDGTTTSLVSGLSIGGDGELIAHEGSVYWFEVEGNLTSVMTVPVSGGIGQRVAEYEGAGAFGLVADREDLYWAVSAGPKSQLLEVHF